jgi:hypothetical protein
VAVFFFHPPRRAGARDGRHQVLLHRYLVSWRFIFRVCLRWIGLLIRFF